MEKLYKLIIEKTTRGMIAQDAAIELITLLKQQGIKTDDDIAIIGISAKLPMADGVTEYWENIENAIDCNVKFPTSRQKDVESYLKRNIDEDEVLKYCEGAYLKNIDRFDHKFFKMSPKEAQLMDPNQRLFIETAWHAVEDAGYGGKKLAGEKTGVFVGFASNIKDAYGRMIYDYGYSEATAIVGNLSSILPSRISYFLDLKGPSMVIDTACSSALVSVTLACQSIRSGLCDTALAGGVKINLFPLDNENEKIGMESPDGRTRTFDENAEGAGTGEGVAAVLLKPLKKALKDGDNIYAVIKGSSINQDGSSIGITAPNPAAQTELLSQIWADSKIDPNTIACIEAHGTATNLGDPIEIKGLEDAFRRITNKNQFCAIGSVKSNLGHLYEAAGMASLLKMVMALKNKKIPPTIHFESPNRTIGFTESPVYVNTRVREWNVGATPRRCGISAFGISGTNCHIVLEEAPVIEKNNKVSDSIHVLTLSAKSKKSLCELLYRYQVMAEKGFQQSIGDLCYTANTGRGHYNYRIAFIASDLAEMEEKIQKFNIPDQENFEKDRIHYGYHQIITENKQSTADFEISERLQSEMTTQAQEKVCDVVAAKSEKENGLTEICRLYVLGAEIDWEKLYEAGAYKVVSLPGYQFEPERCWIDIHEDWDSDVATDENDMFYTMGWQPGDIPSREIENQNQNTSVLVLCDQSKIVQDFVQKLKEKKFSVIEVVFGQTYEQIEPGRYEISGIEADYIKLLAENMHKNISHVVHMFAALPNDQMITITQLQESQHQGVYSLFYLMKALLNQEQKGDIDITVVSSYINEVTGSEERMNPEHAPLFGLGKVVPQEYPHIKCRCIDIDEMVTVTDIMNEMNMTGQSYQVSYRQGKRYTEEFREVEVLNAKDNQIEIRAGGVYLVTGGTRGIGLEMAKFIANKNKVTLALIQRTPIPPRGEWEEILNLGKDERLCKRIRGILEIESLGSNVLLYSLDISVFEDIKAVTEDLRKKYGKINGLIHSAGVPGSGFIINKDKQTLDEILAPKIYGTWNLDQVTRSDKMDFLVLFSSGISVIGEAGQGDYVAANSYLDAYTAYRNKMGQKTLTVNWVSWKETGMSVEFGINVDLTFKTIPTQKALTAFEMALKKDIKQTIIGELNVKSEYLCQVEQLPFGFSRKVQGLIDISKKYMARRAQSRKSSTGGKQVGDVTLQGKENQNYTAIEKKVAQLYNEILGLAEVNIYESFFELGGDSMLLNRLHVQIEKEFPDQVKITDLFANTTVAQLAQFISGKGETDGIAALDNTIISERADTEKDIAIIGIAAEMPMAADVDQFWENIRNGVDCVTELPPARRQDVDDYLHFSDLGAEGTACFNGAFLEEIDKFDYNFFQMSPKEAALTDPYQRLFLKTVWHAIEDSGYGAGKLRGSNTAVFLGFASSLKDSYQKIVYDVDPGLMTAAAVGNITAMMPSRISYLLDLKGPTMVVDTACSSTLVATHLACKAIQNGECDMAIAGGVRIVLLPLDRESMKIGIEADGGITRTFDEKAEGSGLGEGSAALLLKPLSKAVLDGDDIYAVIKGSAVNQDGASMGITAPNPTAQTEVIMKAWADAGINPQTLAFVEAHGTATKLGDPIEIQGLQNAFARFTDQHQFCPISTVKSNVGHLFENAGMAGLLKAILSIKHREIPPTIHFNKPNRKIDFNYAPTYINTKLRKWESNGEPMRGAVSSFGFSGTNCHIVLEAAPAKLSENNVGEGKVFTVSAMSKIAFYNLLCNYRDFVFKQNSEFESICYTVNTGREHYNYRMAFIVKDLEDLKRKLDGACREHVESESDDIFYGKHVVIADGKEFIARDEITKSHKKELNAEANNNVEAFIAAKGDHPEGLRKICQLYVAGAEVDWEKLYFGHKIGKIHLPGYVYDEERCWIEVPRFTTEPEGSFYYLMNWQQEEFDQAQFKDLHGTIVILMDNTGLGMRLADRLRALSCNVVEVVSGSEYRRVDADHFMVRNNQTDYEKMLRCLNEHKITHLIHMFSLNEKKEMVSLAELEAIISDGTHSLLYLTRAYLNCGIRENTEFVLIADYANEVDQNEDFIKPENASMLGLGKVIGQEYQQILCKGIDIDRNTTIDNLVNEIKVVSSVYMTAYRNGKRYTEVFSQVDLDEYSYKETVIKQDGVYVITGGMGGIGLEVAKDLAKKKPHIALLNRTIMPERDDWAGILADGSDRKLIKKIKAMTEMEASGAKVICLSADICNQKQMEQVMSDLRKQYGKINGVIHSAGVAGAGYIIRKDEAIFNRVLAPKIQGTWILDQVTKQDDLDFMVLFSSGASVTGEAGQGDYVAANSYLDSYAAYRNKLGKRTLTINWVQWKEAGMSVEYGINVDGIFKATPTAQAIIGLNESINHDIGRVVVGELNFASEFLAFVDILPFRLSPTLLKIVKSQGFQSGSNVATNGKFEIARVNDGRITLLPRGKRSLLEQGRARSDVKLKGRENEDYNEIEQTVASIYSEILGFREIGIYDNFFDLGGDSIMISQMHVLLEEKFPGKVKLTDLFAATSVIKLAQFINSQQGDLEKAVISTERQGISADEQDIAIIGISANLPGAKNLAEFWENIMNGLDCVKKFPDDRKKDIDNIMLYTNAEKEENLKYTEGAYIDDIDKFDYKFFNMSPKEASLTDPYQRVFLQSAWEAIEDAGYGGERMNGTRTGVYVGYASRAKDNYQKMIYDIEPASLQMSMPGNITALLPTRISYLLNLKGPTMVIDTACSASLVALHLACQALRLGECEMALTGGVRIDLVPFDNEYMRVGVESPTGRTNTFDEAADGAGMGEGVATLLLKPLHHAIRDKDSIYAVVKGSAVNQDGASIGLTAPNPEAQEDVIERAWQNASVSPETLSFIEVHGTATNLGDPIEIDGLNRAFVKYTDKKQFCAVSAVKSNVGHLFENAGMAGLLKGVMAMRHQVIPPSIHFNRPNNKIDFSGSPVYVNTRPRKWETDGVPRRFGISAFGFSGTNCHVIIEEPPERIKTSTRRVESEIFTISAVSEVTLYELVKEYKELVNRQSNLDIGDICYTINTGRGHYTYRLAMIIRDGNDFREKINQLYNIRFTTEKLPWYRYGVHRVVSEHHEAKTASNITEREKGVLSREVDLKIDEFVKTGKSNQHLMEEIMQQYVKGAHVIWDKLYSDECYERVNLPCYPFEKTRCWLDVPEIELLAEKQQPELYYDLKWIIAPSSSTGTEVTADVVLVLMDHTGMGTALVASMRSEGRSVIEVELGEQFTQISNERFVIDGGEQSYVKLLTLLSDRLPQQIIHLFTLDQKVEIASAAELAECQRTGVYSIFYLTRALAKGLQKEMDLILVSQQVNQVTGDELTLHPENAPLFGIGQVVKKEYSNLVCRCIDIDVHTKPECLLRECYLRSDKYIFAYRKGVRYMEEFSAINVAEAADRKVTIKADGVYMITGGLGGIGLAVAKELAINNRVNLALINRTALPKRSDWETILLKAEDQKLCQRIKGVKDLEALGATVVCYRADVADMEIMAEVVKQLKAQFGKVNGVIHGAGISEDATIIARSPIGFETVLAPKVTGTWIIDKLTENEEMDFMVVFSSIATIFCAQRQDCYVAANAYLDAFTAYRNKKGKKTLTINWSTWKETGMAYDHGFNIDTIFKTIKTDQAINGFMTVLNKDVPKALIGEINYQSKIVYLLERSHFRLSDRIQHKLTKYLDRTKTAVMKKSTSSGEVKLSGKESGEYKEIEKILAQVFHEILGFAEIDIYDSFFEMGADSVILTRIQSELEKRFPGVVAITDLFEYSTISKLSQYITEQTEHIDAQEAADPQESEVDLDRIIDEMEMGNATLEQVLDNISKM